MSGKAQVDQYLDSLDSGLRGVVDAVRDLIRRSYPGLREQIKWNAPSFSHNGEDRITLGIERRGGIRVVLHRGAKTKVSSGFDFADPDGLARWPAADRGVILIPDEDAAERQREALCALFRRWIEATSEGPATARASSTT